MRLGALAVIAVVMASAAPQGQALADEAWAQVRRDATLAVWQRDVPGSQVKELKAAGPIDAPPVAVFSVLRDFDHYAQIIPYTAKETRVLDASPDGKTVWYYVVAEAPPISKRDETLKATVEKVSEAGDEVYRVSWVTANDSPKAPPAKEGTVRLKDTRGSWDLKPLENGKTFAVYRIHADPGGALPAVIVNKANLEAAEKLFDALRTWSKRAPYSLAK